MISIEDALYTYEYPGYYKILPSIYNWRLDPNRIGKGKRVNEDFTYSSENNADWMDIKVLRAWIQKNIDKIGKI